MKRTQIAMIQEKNSEDGRGSGSQKPITNSDLGSGGIDEGEF